LEPVGFQALSLFADLDAILCTQLTADALRAVMLFGALGRSAESSL